MNSSNPHDKAQQLADAIIKHESFANYRTFKIKIEEQSELITKLARIRELQMILDRAAISGNPLPQPMVADIHRELKDIRSDQSIAEFFTAEGEFIRLFNELQEIIQNTINRSLL